MDKWGVCMSGVTDQMDGTEGPKTPPNCRELGLQTGWLDTSHKCGPILDAPVFTADSKAGDVWFPEASAKHVDGKWSYRAAALTIETGVGAVEEGTGSAQVGECKAVLLAVKEKTKTICVDSYALWAGATRWLCQWKHCTGK